VVKYVRLCGSASRAWVERSTYQVDFALVAHKPNDGLSHGRRIRVVHERSAAVDVISPQPVDERFDWFERAFMQNQVARNDVYCGRHLNARKRIVTRHTFAHSCGLGLDEDLVLNLRYLVMVRVNDLHCLVYN
jgi:hypothetical protein